jgi:hypothetical protein
MRTWLRLVVEKVLGRIPGKTSRLDTATRMAMDADFTRRDKPTSSPWKCFRASMTREAVEKARDKRLHVQRRRTNAWKRRSQVAFAFPG